MLDGAEGAIDGACAVAMTRGSTEGRNASVAVAPTITAAVAPAATTAPVSTEWLACSVTCPHESPSRRSDSQPRNANTALRPAVRARPARRPPTPPRVTPRALLAGGAAAPPHRGRGPVWGSPGRNTPPLPANTRRYRGAKISPGWA